MGRAREFSRRWAAVYIVILFALLAIIFATRAAHAQGAGCLDLTYTWTTPYQTGTVQSVSYSVTDQYMSVLFFTQDLSVYVNVPQTIAQRATGSNVTGDQFYTQYIRGRYDQALLSQETGCPLIAEETGNLLLAQQR